MRLIRVSYETITPESAENGDTDSTGWINEDGISMEPDNIDIDDGLTAVDLAVKYLQSNGANQPSGSHWHKHNWYIADKYNEDYSTGEVESRHYHLDGFTDDESREIFNRIIKG